jgi:SnoaL-like domain
MSQENVELVKKVMGLFNLAAGGKPTPELLELFAPDVVIDMTRRVFNPDTYEGHDGLRRLGREVSEVWRRFHVEPERFIDAGRQVVVIETRRARGRGSEVEVGVRSGVIWTLQEARSCGWRQTLTRMRPRSRRGVGVGQEGRKPRLWTRSSADPTAPGMPTPRGSKRHPVEAPSSVST